MIWFNMRPESAAPSNTGRKIVVHMESSGGGGTVSKNTKILGQNEWKKNSQCRQCLPDIWCFCLVNNKRELIHDWDFTDADVYSWVCQQCIMCYKKIIALWQTCIFVYMSLFLFTAFAKQRFSVNARWFLMRIILIIDGCADTFMTNHLLYDLSEAMKKVFFFQSPKYLYLLPQMTKQKLEPTNISSFWVKWGWNKYSNIKIVVKYVFQSTNQLWRSIFSLKRRECFPVVYPNIPNKHACEDSQPLKSW